MITGKLDGRGLTTLVGSPNTVFNTFADPVISYDGSEYAYVAQGYDPSHESPMASVVGVPAGCAPPVGGLFYSPSSLTIADNGSFAWTASGQIQTCSGAFPPFIQFSAFDALISRDAS